MWATIAIIEGKARRAVSDSWLPNDIGRWAAMSEICAKSVYRLSIYDLSADFVALTAFYYTIVVGHYVAVNDFFQDFFCLDVSVTRILYARNRRKNVCVQIRIFKTQITTRIHGAILHDKIRCVAQRLGALYMATYQFQVFRVPSKVFAVYGRIIDRHVTTVPKSVLCRNRTVMDFCILGVLERVFCKQGAVVYDNVRAVHKGIVATLHVGVTHINTSTMPKGLDGIVETAFNDGDALHFTKRLGRVKGAMRRYTVGAVPQCGATGFGKC